MVSGSQFKVASRTRSAHDLVAHGIGHSIMQGRFPVGSTLPGDAELMEGLETEILEELGVADPYAHLAEAPAMTRTTDG